MGRGSDDILYGEAATLSGRASDEIGCFEMFSIRGNRLVTDLVAETAKAFKELQTADDPDAIQAACEMIGNEREQIAAQGHSEVYDTAVSDEIYAALMAAGVPDVPYPGRPE